MMLVTNADVINKRYYSGRKPRKKLKTTPLRPVADSPVRDRQARQVKSVGPIGENLTNKSVPVKYKAICIIMPTTACVRLAHPTNKKFAIRLHKKQHIRHDS